MQTANTPSIPTKIPTPSDPLCRIRLRDLNLNQKQAVKQALIEFAKNYTSKGYWNFKESSKGLVKLYQSPALCELAQLDGNCRATIGLILDHELSNLLGFLWPDRLGDQSLLHICQQLSSALFQSRLSLFAVLHALSKIKRAEPPFDQKFHGIQPREILRLMTQYERWITKRVTAIQNRQKQGDSIAGRTHNLAQLLRQSGQLEKLKTIAQKNDERAKQARAKQLSNVKPMSVSIGGLYVFEKVQLWAQHNIPLHRQADFLKLLRQRWQKAYLKQDAQEKKLSVGQFFEQQAINFLKDPSIAV